MGLYRRDDSPVWWYSFTVNGRRFRGSTGQAAKGIAKAIEAAKRTEAAHTAPQRDRWRVHVLTGTYLTAHAAALPSAATATYQLANLTRLLGPQRFVAELTGADIIDYRAKRKGEGVSNSSVNRELQTFRAATNYCRKHYGQVMPAIEWKGLFLKEPAWRTRFLSPDEFAALSAACDDELRTIILIAVSTGLRKANIETLAWDQVSLELRKADVIVKGGDRHTVKLNASVVAALARYNDRTGRIFKLPNRRKRFAAAVAAAGIVNFRFHDLRHTFASWARMAGADIADIKEALHHSEVGMTMRYAHVTPDSHRTAFDAVADLFLPVAKIPLDAVGQQG